jgi:hypothetical protein
MSTVDRGGNADSPPLELIHNTEDGTVTLSPRPLDEVTPPVTEWITTPAEDLVDVRSMR